MLEIHNFTQNDIKEKFFEKIAEVVLKIVNIKDKVEISLAIVGDGRIRKLNKMYRGSNRVTDVLSFENKPASPSGGSVIPYLSKAFPRMKKGEKTEFVETPDGVNRLGEVVICYPRAKKQAKRLNHSLEKELTILFVHGILHLLKYEHEQGGIEAKKMEQMEKKVIQGLK